MKRVVKRRPKPKTQRAYVKVPKSDSSGHWVYEIVICGKSYIGYTSRDPAVRLAEHLTSSIKGTTKLYTAFRSSNYDFSFSILNKYMDEKTALLMEIRQIEEKDTINNGLNSVPGGTGNAYTFCHKNKEFRLR